ncbi:MAG: hypothetical protein H0W41_05305 [Chloroflexi bacterium]|nr:hypothetical protein [Chloroflexota bacterium]
MTSQRGGTARRRENVDHRIVEAQQPGGDAVGDGDGGEELRHRCEAEPCLRCHRNSRRPVRHSVATFKDRRVGSGYEDRAGEIALAGPSVKLVVERGFRLGVSIHEA